MSFEDIASKDKSTIVSVVPWDIKEKKPSIYPGDFYIPAAPKGDISILVVGQSHSYITMDGRKIRSTTPSIQMAESVARDYINDSLDIYEDAHPGIFAIFGEYTKERAKKELALQIVEADRRQRNWFERLVKDADDNWSRNHMLKAISDIHRVAARYLDLDKEWIKTYAQDSLSRCPVCTTQVDPAALICTNCKNVLKPEEYKKVFKDGQALLTTAK